ncbi:response regulator [Methylomonas sp. EFPC3]|uniref:Hpt domain-containing response regulator n=1 Tax=Methylomonas sp. EFPC3 TaxID=3021710 RepID=UPI002415B147|nr:response regulator [Methylomonas sp. EFPC3]WFP49979.1 response regulator [Methylomonas sp. EFPC3]
MAADCKILIADDNETNLWLLCEQLSQWTQDVMLAGDGRQAWSLLEQHRFSLLFLDLNMPFLSGFDLISRLRSQSGPNCQTPAVAVTAHAQESQRIQALAVGFDDYLVKPIRLARLQEILERWQAEDVGVDYYARQLLGKTRDNKPLSQMLISKLFAELPVQLADIERLLGESANQQAWEIVHKLHGTFCFFDFADCRTVTESLEQALLSNQLAQADQHFEVLKQKSVWLLNNQAAVLQSLAAG